MDYKEKVVEWIDSNQLDIAKVLSEMVKIPSVNPFFEDNKEVIYEEKFQEFLANYLEEMGMNVELWEPNAKELAKYEGKAGYYEGRDFTNRPNLHGELKGTGGGKSILLFGHADVVKAGDEWQEDPFGGEIKDGRIYGRGTVDMKGGIAAMVMAVKAIKESGIKLKGDVYVGSVSDEEAGGMGTLAYVDKGYRADGCIVTEPTKLNIAPLCRGILWGKLTVLGRAGHIEMDQEDWRTGGAVDAIDKATLFLEHFKRLNKEWAITKKHPLLPIPCQINIAQFNAGEYPTSYASKAEIVFNAQYLPSEKDENGLGSNVKKEIEDFVMKVANTDPWLQENLPEIQWIVDADCGETDYANPFVQTMEKAALSINNDITVEGLSCHSDMGWLIESGIPTVNFGPGEPRIAHQADEYVEVSKLIEATKIIALTIINWCGIEE
jgi:acetylornithine deacetylase